MMTHRTRDELGPHGNFVTISERARGYNRCIGGSTAEMELPIKVLRGAG